MLEFLAWRVQRDSLLQLLQALSCRAEYTMKDFGWLAGSFGVILFFYSSKVKVCKICFKTFLHSLQ